MDPPRQKLLMAQLLDDLLHQCMKLAAQEKITSKNSWNLPLIDHIDEMGLEHDFIKASGAISVSTKIYSGRVDKLYSDCIQVANLTGITEKEGAGDDPETVTRRVTRYVHRKQHNSQIDVDPQQLQLQYEANDFSTASISLHTIVDDTQNLLSLPFNMVYCNSDMSASFIPQCVELVETDHERPDKDGLATQINNVLCQSQRFHDNVKSEDVEFVSQGSQPEIEEIVYTSVLDNSMAASQLSDSQIDYFMNSNQQKEDQSVQHGRLARPKNLPRPRQAKQCSIDFSRECMLKMVSTKAKNAQKPKEIEIFGIDNLQVQRISLDHVNQLLVGDYQVLATSQLSSNANLSIVIENQDSMHVQFDEPANAPAFSYNSLDYGQNDVYRQNNNIFKSQTSEVQNYDVNIGLQQIKIQFAQRPKVINIQQLKQVLRTEIEAQRGCGPISLKTLMGEYKTYHTDTVCRNPDDVSRAYQFVGLLHLANEQGFQLVNVDGDILIQ